MRAETTNERPREPLEGDGHRADAVDEVARHVGRLARLDAGQPREQLPQDRPQLRSGAVSALVAWRAVWRVVALPATASSTTKAATSASVSRSPSTSAWTRLLIRSSPGFFRRSAASAPATWCRYI